MPQDLTDSRQTSSGEPPPSDTPLQRLDSFDLFNNLLFNRENVYQNCRRVSPIETVAVKDDTPGEKNRMKSKDRAPQSAGSVEKEANMPSNFGPLLFYLDESAVAASDSGKRPRKTTLDKPRTRPKRPTLGGSSIERGSKIIKTLPEANTSKRVNGRGATLLDAIILSDDDDTAKEPRRRFSTRSLTPPHEIKADGPSSDDDIKPSQFLTPKPICSLTSDFEVVRLKAAHAKEMADLHHQLNTSEVRARQIKAEAEQAAAELQRCRLVDSNKHTANLEEKLENERNRSNDLRWECKHLRQQLGDAHASLEKGKEIKEQRDAYERLYKEQRDTTADLQREKAEQQDLAQRKERVLTEQIASLAARHDLLQREVSQLQDDNIALQTDSAALQDDNAALQSDNNILQDDGNDSLRDGDSDTLQDNSDTLQDAQSTQFSTSFTASTSTSDPDQTPDYEQRLANMRKTYIAIKKKHDMLSSVATGLASATRGWDYGNFGEFGGYLRQLGAVLGEDLGDEGPRVVEGE
ncbi:hypothetical protein B5807_02976 [Epicoccum nigrum]|uniref:Uncharacterized protein n=1 Tax=Epicoccum nigrum TaxID=105696 RepID=A0A1Y2M981_EPING|nr:hypothetical protein B5807_02976 [Epicoccum nigrum]